MGQEYRYPPDTSWLPPRGAAPGWHWGAISMALSLVPFVLLVIPEFHDVVELALASWMIGVLIGLRGLHARGPARTFAWVGVLMNIGLALASWLLAPLIVGLLMSQAFS